MVVTLRGFGGSAGVHLNRGRVTRFAYVNPNRAEPAIGIWGEDRAPLVGGAVPAGLHNIDCFLRDAETDRAAGRWPS